MTNLEIRNYAYDTISSYLFDHHADFCYSLYDEVRAGGTIESAVEKYLKSHYEEIGNVLPHLVDTASKWDVLTGEREKILALSCDLIIDIIGVEHLFSIESLTEFLNPRNNYRLGFLTLEECANKIVDMIRKHIRRPSIHIIDSVFGFIGLPRYFDCVDSRTIYLSK